MAWTKEDRKRWAALEQVIGKQWFFPLLKEVAKFEKALDDLMPESVESLPDWSLNCMDGVDGLVADYTGGGPIEGLNSRRFGKMIGAKASMCESYAKSLPIWKMLNKEQVAKIEEKWGQGSVKGAILYCTAFAKYLTPAFRIIMAKIKARLDKLQGVKEMIDYWQGFGRGMEFMREVGRQIRKPRNTKRDQDTQKRAAVYAFAIIEGPKIEANKQNLTWMKIAESFDKWINHELEIDEESLKKILSRNGLKDVGRVGRPPKAK